MKVQFKRLLANAQTPKYSLEGDACLDLFAAKIHILDNFIEYNTGIAIQIPKNHLGLVFPRSSISKFNLSLANSVGVIDSNYRGPIKLRFRYKKGDFNIYKIGDRIGQMLILPYPKIVLEQVDDLDDTNRGDGGFGSTGN